MSPITDSFSGDSVRPACACMDSDPQTALAAMREATTTDSLTDESHFMVSLLCCESCGQCFLKLFTELIDWSGGDDSQAWMYVPISAKEVEQLRAAGDAVDDRFLLGMKIHRRFLSRLHPRGGEVRVQWGSGPLVILPHD